MKLIQLRLENFRQHESSCIDFHEGMTAIVGANGAGKSTILEAITFALYGTQRDKKETIRYYWSKNNNYRVELQIEFDDRRYLIERTKNDASLTDITDQEIVRATGLSAVNDACRKLLGLNYEQFKNSFCAEQKELKFLDFDKARRQEEVARMLGFDRLKKAEEIARKKRSHFKSVAESMEKFVTDPEELRLQKIRANDKLTEMTNELKKLETQLKELQAKIPQSQSKHQEAQKWKQFSNEMDSLRGRAEGLKESVKLATHNSEAAQKEFEEFQKLLPIEKEFAQSQADLKKLEQAREQEREREKRSHELKNLQTEVQELEKQIQDLKVPDLKQLETEFSETAKHKQKLEADLSKLKDELQHAILNAKSDLAGKTAGKEQAEKALQKAEEKIKEGICPECGQPITETYKDILEGRCKELDQAQKLLDEAIKAAEQLTIPPPEIAKLEADLKETAKKEEQIKLAQDEAWKLDNRAKMIRESLTTKQSKCDQLTKELEASPAQFDANQHKALQEKLEALQPQHNRFLALEDSEKRLQACNKAKDEATANYEQAKTRYRELEMERGKLSFESPEEVERALHDHEVLLKSFQTAESELKHTALQVDHAQKELNDAVKRIEDNKEKIEELRSAKANELLNSTAATELRNLREKLNTSIRPDLMFRASENLALLTNNRYPSLEIDDDFQPVVTEDGIRKPVISGGEEDVVALALRLALSELIQEKQGRPLSLFILDEVFGSLDTERRQSVLDRLSAMKGRFRQILVISHIEEINQVADQCIYLQRDEEARKTVIREPVLEELTTASYLA